MSDPRDAMTDDEQPERDSVGDGGLAGAGTSAGGDNLAADRVHANRDDELSEGDIDLVDGGIPGAPEGAPRDDDGDRFQIP